MIAATTRMHGTSTRKKTAKPSTSTEWATVVKAPWFATSRHSRSDATRAARAIATVTVA